MNDALPDMIMLPEIRLIVATDTLPLRSTVLRPHRPIEESVFAGDDDPTTFHLGVFANATLVGVASLYQEPLPATVIQVGKLSVEPPYIWRLRGMAVEPTLQGQGYGRQLLTACLQRLADHGGRLLWCNARKSALGFYQAAGFEICGPEFVISEIGPHYVMLRYIEKCI